MDDLTFLDEAEVGNLMVKGANGSVSIPNLNEQYFDESAPVLLAQATLEDEASVIRLNNGESRVAFISLLRYIYLKDYRLSVPLIDQPCSILFHLQMYKLAQLYVMPDLEDQAKRYLFCELEYACSVKMMAIDLCNAIRFIFLELDDEPDLKASVAHYCVQNFLYHNLSNSEAFKQTVYEAPVFHQLLLRTNLEQGFSADGADEIMKMQVCPFGAHRSWDKSIRRAANFLCRLHTDEPQQSSIPMQREPEPWMEPSRSNSFVLVDRPRFDWPSGKNATHVPSISPITVPLRPGQPLSPNHETAEASARSIANDFFWSDFNAATDTTDDGADAYNEADQLFHHICTEPSPHSAEFVEASDQSDSDWSVVDPVTDDHDFNPLLVAAVNPARTGPLRVQNDSISDEQIDEDWDNFKWENGLD